MEASAPVVLIVDDESSARLTTEALLLRDGFTLRFAESGAILGISQRHGVTGVGAGAARCGWGCSLAQKLAQSQSCCDLDTVELWPFGRGEWLSGRGGIAGLV